MKKLLLMAGALLFMASCDGPDEKKEKPDSAAATSADTSVNKAVAAGSTTEKQTLHEKTLNGVPMATALQMIKNFESAMSNSNPPVVNYFLSRGMIEKIITLLEAEKSKPINGHQTDGVRIYFGKETSSTDIQLLLVSTIDSTSSAHPNMEMHHDYYRHTSPEADILFGSDLKIPMFNRLASGANLYTTAGNQNDDETCRFDQQHHYLRRAVAHRMVMNFAKQQINTTAEWFDLDMLKDLISNKKCDGVRVYLARHSSLRRNAKYPNQVAFILTTTHVNDKGIYEDYFDCNTLNSFYKKQKDKGLPMFQPPYDNGELCPNNCN